MNKEEKARAYDEALNWMRTIYPSLSGADKEDAEHFFPDLRESEDERIIEKIIDCLNRAVDANYITLADRGKCLAYLEKKKEQKTPMSNDLDEEIERFFDECIEAHDAKIYGVDKQVITVDCYELTARHFAQWQKGQKPEDDKIFEEWIDDWWKHNKVNNPDSYNKGDEIQFDEKGFKNFCRGIRNMYQQKPAVTHGETYRVDTLGTQQVIAGKMPQKPAEWGEEDEKIYGKARDAIYYQDLNDKDEVVDALKALCDLISRKRKVIPPYARWKPSDEQMKALSDALEFMPDTFKPKCTLESLERDLKKL